MAIIKYVQYINWRCKQNSPLINNNQLPEGETRNVGRQREVGVGKICVPSVCPRLSVCVLLVHYRFSPGWSQKVQDGKWIYSWKVVGARLGVASE